MKAIFRRLLLVPFALVAAGVALSSKGKSNEAICLGEYEYVVPGEGKVCCLYKEGLSDIPYETSVTVADYGIRSFCMPTGDGMDIDDMLDVIYEDAKPEKYSAAGIDGYLVTGDSKAFIWADDSVMYVIQCWGPDPFCDMVFNSIEKA